MHAPGIAAIRLLLLTGWRQGDVLGWNIQRQR
jgi:hypothetical protein